MEDKKVTKEKIAGSDLTLTEYGYLDYITFQWELQSLAIADKRDNGYELKPQYHPAQAGFTDITGFFQSVEEVFSFVREYLIQHEDLQEFLRKRHQEAKDEAKKCLEYNRAERAKYYHLELEDLTPEHNIYYSDLISTKLRHSLVQAEVYTLADICHWKRRDFKNIRNCGEKTTKELENLLHHVGLDWDMPKEGTKTDSSSNFDDGFKSGYDAAVLAAKTWLQENPDCFMQPDGAEKFQKAMDEGI